MTPQDIDVLIIGAGINGAGLFRDLCEQGVSAAIIDKGDYGSGTSAAPSRLIHGGIKYLETGEFRLVAQSTLERNLLLKNAPHYVRPLPTVIPIFSWWKGIPAAIRTLLRSTTAPRSRGAVLMKIGLWLYDFYGARHRVMPRHALWGKTRALQEIPPLTPRIVAAGAYYDATVSHPERLVLELIGDGLRANPAAMAMNHASILQTDGRAIWVQTADGRQVSLKPRVVVNAAGPWIDKVNAVLGLPSHLIGGTKGSHILLDHPGLISALNGRMIYFEADDGRICLVFDYLGKALVGSTDMRATDPDAVICQDDEVAYFLQSLRSLLPGLAFDQSQIVYSYAGIRPLPASDGTAVGLISRDHSAPVAEPQGNRAWPVISLVGGKWTTFRGFAEEVTDGILARLGRNRQISTRLLPIGGGRDYPAVADDWAAQAARASSATPDRALTLLRRYGTTASLVLQAEGGAAQMLVNAPGYSRQELVWIIGNEQVAHLSDLVMRRTTMAITGALTAAALAEIADITAATLGWTDERRVHEVAQTTATLVDHHRLRLA